jgi:hypothetical protein
MMSLTAYGQFSSNNGNSNASKNIGNEISLWMNIVLLLILGVMFVCSVQFSPKCRRRTKKLPHQIRLERTNKEITQQRTTFNIKPSSSFINNIYETSLVQDDQYVNIEEEEDEEPMMENELYLHDTLTESKDSDCDDDDELAPPPATRIVVTASATATGTAPPIMSSSNGSNIVEHGKLLINNINHYIQTQYDEYRGSHNQFMQDMLGMTAYNNAQQQHKHPSTQNDSDYEPL